jgi:hypothetical protein
MHMPGRCGKEQARDEWWHQYQAGTKPNLTLHLAKMDHLMAPFAHGWLCAKGCGGKSSFNHKDSPSVLRQIKVFLLQCHTGQSVMGHMTHTHQTNTEHATPITNHVKKKHSASQTVCPHQVQCLCKCGCATNANLSALIPSCDGRYIGRLQLDWIAQAGKAASRMQR